MLTRRTIFMPAVLLLLGISVARAQTPPATATAPAALPTAPELRAEIAAGQVHEALPVILRILDLKGPLAAPYDRAEMYLLRAECQLQLRLTQPAVQALDAAAKEARNNPTSAKNPDFASQAWGLSALIAKSPNLTYTPKTRTGVLPAKPVGIADPATRIDACKALLADTLPDIRAKVRATEAATAMAPVLDAAKNVSALRFIEKTATGDAIDSKALTADLTTRAATMLSVALGNMHNTVEGISQAANTTYTYNMQQSNPVTGNRGIVQVPRRRGLTNDQIASLKNLQQTCNQIGSTCGDLTLALDAADTFRPLATDASGLAQQIGKILADDYTRMP